MATPASAWRCTACGYVHRDPQRPEFCPVCGAGADDFEPLVETGQAPASPPLTDQWRCLNCSYVHEGPEPCDVCPVCGAQRDRFEPVAPPPPAAAARGTARILIVGGGVAGVSAAQAARQTNPDAQIALLTREVYLPYYRLNLTRLLAGELALGDLPICPRLWYDRSGIELLLGHEVTGLDLPSRQVHLNARPPRGFDRLILTAGAHPFMPPLAGAHRHGVTALRTIDDAARILEALQPGIRCVCVGGGLLGLETAGALSLRGADVTLVEGHGWLMPRQLDAASALRLQQHVQDLNIRLRMKARPKEILGDERAAGLLLEDGTVLDADLIVIAAGVRPNSYLARRSGLEVNQGIVVDNHLRTSHPDVLAAGDLAEHRGVLYGTWAPSQFQGQIAGRNAAGEQAEFGGIPRSNTLKVLGLDMLSIGQVQGEDASFRVLEHDDDRKHVRLVFRDTHLVGAVLVGPTTQAGQIKRAIENRLDLSALLQANPSVPDVLDHLAQT